MELNITPGDWYWYDSFGRKLGVGKATPGENILGDKPPVGQISHNSYVVADEQGFVVARCSNPLVTMESSRSEDNAKLLARAPKLHAALKSLNAAAATIDSLTQGLKLPDDVEQALAALWKANQGAEEILAMLQTDTQTASPVTAQ